MNAALVAGTTSDAGKSVVTVGCAGGRPDRGGRFVAPFKAQNMSLNSMVTSGGAEIGGTQAMQVAAGGIEPTTAVKPVLLESGAGGPTETVLRAGAS